jgi:hypothetical protein
MTREEAIEQLNFMIETIPKEPSAECDSIKEWLDTDKDIRNALEMAINALEREPCEDCISRQAVLDIITFEDKWLFDANGHNANTHIAFSGLESRIKALPPVTPQHTDAEIQKMQEMEQAEIEKAYNMGVSEKETVLGKMRTEIERHRRKTQGIDPYDLVGDCLEIIDKYNAESED